MYQQQNGERGFAHYPCSLSLISLLGEAVAGRWYRREQCKIYIGIYFRSLSYTPGGLGRVEEAKPSKAVAELACAHVFLSSSFLSPPKAPTAMAASMVYAIKRERG